MRTCAACGFENPETAKFCSECGASLVRAEPAGEERKVVSVVELIDDSLGVGGAHTALVTAWDIRARIAAARGERIVAWDSIREAVELSRARGDMQILWPTLVGLAHVAGRLGFHDDSEAALHELVSAMAASETVGDVQDEHAMLIRELDAQGRSAEAREIFERMPAGRWTDVCGAILRHDFAMQRT